MLYYLFHWLERFDVPGARLFDYLTFRSGMAFVLALFIGIFIGKDIINRLKTHQMHDSERTEDMGGNPTKQGTPTMGGIIIIISILVPCLLLGKLDNIYMLLMLVSTVWCGALGFADDYDKIFNHHKEGIKGKWKIVGQVGLGLIVGITMWTNSNILIHENVSVTNRVTAEQEVVHKTEASKAPKSTIPFIKNHNFDYSYFFRWTGKHATACGWLLFVFVAIFVVAAVSNGANLTDGVDGLATGVSAINMVALAIMCYLGGNVIYSGYLDIMYIPGSGELFVFAASFIGATIGFLWYNTHPAQVFMGDTGSLMLGGNIAVFALLIRKEWLLPLLCGIYLVWALSDILQVRVRKWHLAHGKGDVRLLKMAPLHHHFIVKNEKIKWGHVIKRPGNPIPEEKFVMRVFLVAIMLAALTFVTLKIR